MIELVVGKRFGRWQFREISSYWGSKLVLVIVG